MNRRLYVVYDIVGEAPVGPIMQYKHDAQAMRAFGDVCADKEGLVGSHPADFDLRLIGELQEEGPMLHLLPPAGRKKEPAPFIVLYSGALWLEAQSAR